MSPVFQKYVIDLFTNRTRYTDWSDKILYLDKDILDVQRQLFNTSVMYVTQDDFAHRFIRVQKQLSIRGYHIIQKGIMRSIACFIANEEFQFNERLKEIFLLINSAGLYDLWFRQDDFGKERSILKINRERLEKDRIENAGKVDSPSVMPMFIVYGLVASSILFLGEITWYNFSAKFVGNIRLRIYPFRKR